MTLYEIDSAILSLVDPETGELLDYGAFDALNLERDKKIEGMALWVKDLEATSVAITTEIRSLQERRKASEAKAERLKGYLDEALGGIKFSTPRCMVTFTTPSAVQVDDPEELIRWAEQHGYDNCIRYGKPEVSKTGVKALIQTGVVVPYAQIVKRRSVGVK